MVRVHVRPPFACRRIRRREIFGKGQGRRPATARSGGDSRGLPPSRERPPRGGCRRGGANSFLLVKKVARGSTAARRRFFVKKQAGAPARGAAARERGRPGRLWRPGCTGARRMPWRRQAMKDAASCENPRGGACGP